MPPECNRPLANGSLRQQYVIYDAQARGVGIGSCLALDGADTETGPKGTCHFRFWLPIDREISIDLRAEFVPVLQSLYAQAITILSAATDIAASANIAAWDNK